MKKELCEFVMEKANREYQDDFPIEKIPLWIEEFFSTYQPERLNPEGCTYPSYFPPPWDVQKHPKKTHGWIAFQKALEDEPEYYNMR